MIEEVKKHPHCPIGTIKCPNRETDGTCLLSNPFDCQLIPKSPDNPEGFESSPTRGVKKEIDGKMCEVAINEDGTEDIFGYWENKPKPEQTYTLNCDNCGKCYQSPGGFPSPQLCPECFKPDESRPNDARIYPCLDCGKLRSKDEGGTTFSLCEECLEKRYPKMNEPDIPFVSGLPQPVYNPDLIEPNGSRLLTREQAILVSAYVSQKKDRDFLGKEGFRLWWMETQRFLKAQRDLTASIYEQKIEELIREVVAFIDWLDNGLRSSASWRSETRKFRQALKDRVKQETLNG